MGNIIVEHGAIPAVISAAKQHAANPVVLGGAAGVLRNLAAVSEANRTLIIEGGGIDALDTAIMNHAENERLKTEVAGARRNLLGEAAVPRTDPTRQDSRRAGRTTKRGDKSDRSASPSARQLKKEAAAKAGAPGAVPLSERKLEPVKEKKGTVRASFGGLSRRAKPKK